jgi:V/A-type H+-transporting ATPase subunit F
MPTNRYPMAVIGEKDIILGFKALGVHVFPAASPEEALAVLKRLAREKYAVILLTEKLAQPNQEAIEELNKRFLPVVLLVPGSRGSLGLGLKKLKEDVEKAIGADILFRKEG